MALLKIVILAIGVTIVSCENPKNNPTNNEVSNDKINSDTSSIDQLAHNLNRGYHSIIRFSNNIQFSK